MVALFGNLSPVGKIQRKENEHIMLNMIFYYLHEYEFT